MITGLVIYSNRQEPAHSSVPGLMMKCSSASCVQTHVSFARLSEIKINRSSDRTAVKVLLNSNVSSAGPLSHSLSTTLIRPRGCVQ